MRIGFQSEGGFGYFPGLDRPLTIDTSQLSPEKASTLEALVRAADFFGRPKTLGAADLGAADHRSYTLTVEDGGRSHAIRVSDPVNDSAIQALVDYLRLEQRSDSGTAGSS